MRQQFFLLFTLLCLARVSKCQDESDADLATYLQSLAKGLTTTTKSDDVLNLDPDTEDNVEVTGRSDNPKPQALDDPVTPCKTEEGESGVCVTYYLCELGTARIIDDGNTLIDARTIDECPNVLDTCCLPNQVASTTNSSKPTKPSAPSDEKDNTLNNTGDDSAYRSSSDKALESPVTDGKCGYSNPGVNVFKVREGSPSPSDRVYADFGEFPWMVAILRRSTDTEWNVSNYIGGGSLIHPSVVMTAAHKVARRKAEQMYIRAGEFETNSEDELYDHQDINVAKIVVHPNYYRASLYNDIALLVLEEPVNLNDAPHIGIGCLAPQLPPPGTKCFSMGWGAENFANKKVFASLLKKVKLPLVEKTQCETNLRKTRLGRIFRLHQSLVCAGGEEGVDTCRGDGGSSLVCPLDAKGSRFAIYGMVAYGMGCGGKDIPGVYVNVADLYDWVGQQLVTEGLDPKSYTI